MKLDDEALHQFSAEVVTLVAERLDGCELDEAMQNIQVIIGCLYEQMVGNVGHHKALMYLGNVLKHAAKHAPPDCGVNVELIHVPKTSTKKH